METVHVTCKNPFLNASNCLFTLMFNNESTYRSTKWARFAFVTETCNMHIQTYISGISCFSCFTLGISERNGLLLTLIHKYKWDGGGPGIKKVRVHLGTVAKLWSTSKRLLFKQCLIYTWLSFKKDGFNKKLYFFSKQFCLKMHIVS